MPKTHPKPVSAATMRELSKLLNGCTVCCYGENGKPKLARCAKCCRKITKWCDDHFLSLALTQVDAHKLAKAKTWFDHFRGV